MSPFLIPLAVFAMVVLIVAITHVARIRDKEMEVHQKLHATGDGAPTQNAGTGVGTRAYKARDLARLAACGPEASGKKSWEQHLHHRRTIEADSCFPSSSSCWE